MTTKDRIESEALDLFSVKGYTGVSIRDIAGRVGIKESSIYKHYKSKEDIFNTIKAHYQEKTQNVFGAVIKDRSAFLNMSPQVLIAMIKTNFQSFAADGYISKCRKLFMISAPANKDIGKMYTENFITTPIAFNTEIFHMILEAAGHQKPDAEAMAYHFYAPVFCILQEYDNGILTMEESLNKIEKITVKFMEVYRV